MIVFAVVTVSALVGLFLRQSALRFKASKGYRPAVGKPPSFKIGAYFKWLRVRARAVFSAGFLGRTRSVWNGWAEARYPGRLKWGFFAFAAAFLYLAASGLFFAAFIRRGLYGLPLLAHVASGGLFAVGLASVMLLRARDYRFDQSESAVFESFACPIFKNLSVAFVRKVLFWIIAGLGFVQIATALLSMLPIITFNTQVGVLAIHRWSALGLTLAAVLFFDLALLERPKPSRP